MANKLTLDKIVESDNVADLLDEDTQQKIANKVVRDFEIDNSSRRKLNRDLDVWEKLATQVTERKDWPWQNAANIKYPMLTVAALQFHSRAYPALFSVGKLVKGIVVGDDPKGEKRARADRVSTHMSYQMLYGMKEWEENMDRLLLALPITGTEFKKTYYDAVLDENVSIHVPIRNLIVNYWAKDFAKIRKTEIFYEDKNEVVSKQRRGVYLDVALKEPPANEANTTGRSSADDNSIHVGGLYTELEYHGWYDLDNDGYEEPYIITVNKDSGNLLRMVARYELDDITLTQDDEVIYIEAEEYYTKYSFIPNPSGSFYGLGFGSLLTPLNNTVNTTINQLLDAGTLSNMQSGFIGRGARMRAGTFRFKPGEWKLLNVSGDDLKRNIMPLPVHSPSEVLHNLLKLMLQAGDDIASTKDILIGDSPGQNQPATTSMMVREEGLKVFTAIYKRVRRAFDQELKKLYRLNATYMNKEEYYKILDSDTEARPITKDDYGPDLDVIPAADANTAIKEQRVAKGKELLQLAMSTPTLDNQEALRRYLEDLEIPDVNNLFVEQVPPPQPDFDQQAKLMTAQAAMAKVKADEEEVILNAKIDLLRLQSQQEFNAEKQELSAAGVRQKDVQLQIEIAELLSELNSKEEEVQSNGDKGAVRGLGVEPGNTGDKGVAPKGD